MSKRVIVISGLPRSGTSMMMQMLEAGGIEIGTDNRRKPDIHNPKGYYEIEKIKDLKNDSAWIQNMCGKAIKVISHLLYYLPLTLQYSIIFMQRDMQEILISQRKMLNRLGRDNGTVNDGSLAKKFETHLQKVNQWMKNQKNIDFLYINYNTLLVNSSPSIENIQKFLCRPVALDRMESIINLDLYRNRNPES